MSYNVVLTRDIDKQACYDFLALDTLDYEHLDWLSAQERLFDPFSFALLDGSSIKAILSFSADVPQISWISFFASLRDGNHASYFYNIYAQGLQYLKSYAVDSVYLLDLRPWMTILAQSQGFQPHDQIISFAYTPSAVPRPHLNREVMIRSMRSTDLEAVQLLDRSCFLPQWQLGLRGLQKLHANGGVHSVLFHGNHLIAYAMHSTYGAFAHLDRIAVSPGFQAQGYGKTLIISQIQTLLKSGVIKFTVNTQSSNLPSQALYHGLGYKETGTPVPVLRYSIR